MAIRDITRKQNQEKLTLYREIIANSINEGRSVRDALRGNPILKSRGNNKDVFVPRATRLETNYFIFFHAFMLGRCIHLTGQILFSLAPRPSPLFGNAIALINPQRYFIEQNAAHYSLMGYSDDNLFGQSLAIFDYEQVFSVIFEELLRCGSYRGEVTIRTKSGT